jgi:hypothetical protein
VPLTANQQQESLEALPEGEREAAAQCFSWGMPYFGRPCFRPPYPSYYPYYATPFLGYGYGNGYGYGYGNGYGYGYGYGI